MNPLIYLAIALAVGYGLLLWILHFDLVSILLADALLVGGVEAVFGTPHVGKVGGGVAVIASVAIVLLGGVK